MGMFDSIFGNVNCLNCGHLNKVEIQFKWSRQLLDEYHIGDTISNAPEGYYVVDERWHHCDECNNKLNARAVLKDGKVILVTTEDVNKLDFNKIPIPEDGIGKKLLYEEDCRKGLGQTNEYEDISLHPKNVEDTIRALNNEWTILEVYEKVESEPEKKSLLKLAGCWGRKSDKRYVYKVINEQLGERWIEVEDRDSWRYRNGNMVVSKEPDLLFDTFKLNKLS